MASSVTMAGELAAFVDEGGGRVRHPRGRRQCRSGDRGESAKSTLRREGGRPAERAPNRLRDPLGTTQDVACRAQLLKG
jgi:hypothetical protein